jgi:hypothetical protein
VADALEVGCCACGISAKLRYLVCLWDGCYSCARHTKAEIVAADKVQNVLRVVERGYFERHKADPGAIVWASSCFAQLRAPAGGEQMPRMPDAVPVLVVPDDAEPKIFAVGKVLASVMLGALGGKYCMLSVLKDRASRLSSVRIAAKLGGGRS